MNIFRSVKEYNIPDTIKLKMRIYEKQAINISEMG
jgi:hypothetical protein